MKIEGEVDDLQRVRGEGEGQMEIGNNERRGNYFRGEGRG